VKDDGEPVGILVGKRLQQHRVHDTDGKTGVPGQRAKTIADVARDRAEERPEPDVAPPFLDLLDASDFDRRGAPRLFRGNVSPMSS
jgi:hypothetical protein